MGGLGEFALSMCFLSSVMGHNLWNVEAFETLSLNFL